MKKDNFNIKKINKSNFLVEKQFNKLDEWHIPRDRKSFYLTHDFHPYFAAYPPDLVKKILLKYSKENDVFLDPFMGGGSSIVEGYVLGKKTIGIDISSFSKFISEVKTTPIKLDFVLLNKILKKISKEIEYNKNNGYGDFKYKIPDITNIKRWFSDDAAFDLTIILNNINKIDDLAFKNFLLLGFSSIIRKVSNAKNAQQHLCIKKNKKIPSTNLLFQKKIQLMSQQMEDYVKKLGSLKTRKLPKLYSIDIRNLCKIIKPESVDIIITSPPYGTGSRYTDVNRMNFEWLGLAKPKRNETLETSKDFKEELKKGIHQMYKVLKKNGYCFLVYGDPSTEESITKIAIEDAKKIGFKYLGLISCPIEKTLKNHHEKYRRFIPKDFILIFRK